MTRTATLLAALLALAPLGAQAAARPAKADAKASSAKKPSTKTKASSKTETSAPAEVADQAAVAALKPADTATPAAPAAPVAPAVDRVEAAKLAIWQRLFQEGVPTRMAAEGKYLTVHPVSEDFGGSKNNPITGVGPIANSVVERYVGKDATSQALSKAAWAEAREYAAKLGMSDKIPAGAGELAPEKTAGTWARLMNDHFSKYGNRTFVVDVDANGNGATQQGFGTIDSVLVHNFQTKLAKAFSSVKAVLSPQLFKDVVKATQPKQIATLLASVTGVGGSIATANPIAMIAATAAAAVAVQSATAEVVNDVKSAIASRNTAQNKAVAGAAQWAQASLKTADPATSLEAYREYKVQLQNALPGTSPMTFEKFVGQLQLQHL